MSEIPGLVILGAGAGSRLLPLTAEIPKWRLPLLGTPLIDLQIAVAHRLGITEVTVVRGLKGGQARSPSVFHVDDTAQLNMVHSLFKAGERFLGDTVVSYADIIYEPRVLTSMLLAKADVAVVVDTAWERYYAERASEPLTIAESLRLGDAGLIESIGQPLGPGEVPEGQYIGLIRFSSAGAKWAHAVYKELSAEFSGKPWRNSLSFEHAFMTDFLQELVDRGLDVQAVPTDGGWLEFDSLRDYELACLWAESDGAPSIMNFKAMPTRPTVVSAGGVLWRADGQEVILVGDGSEGSWRLPKGMQDPGEVIENTAVREVVEETGRIGRILGAPERATWTYSYDGIEWEEHAYFFPMAIDPTAPTSTPDGEHKAVRWFETRTARNALRFESEQKALESLVGRWTRD